MSQLTSVYIITRNQLQQANVNKVMPFNLVLLKQLFQYFIHTMCVVLLTQTIHTLLSMRECHNCGL